LFNPRKIRNLPAEYDLKVIIPFGGPEGRSRGPVVPGVPRWQREGSKEKQEGLE